MTRIEKRFAALTQARRQAFVAFVMAGDPDLETALAVLKGMPSAGVCQALEEVSPPASPRRVARAPHCATLQ